MNVYLDGDFAFGVSRLVGAWLHVGQILSEEKIAELLAQDQVEKAYQKAIRFIQYRFRSEKEISDKLRSEGYNDDLIGSILMRLKDHGMAGDMEFARVWVENRTSLRPRSRRLMRIELQQKGINKSVIDHVLSEAPDESQLAEALAQKYLSRVNECEWVDFQKKLGGYLLRKGFDYQITREVLHKLWDRLQTSDET